MLDLVSRREAVRRVLVVLTGVVSTPTLSALLAGCEGRSGGADGEAVALTSDQRELVATVAEHIIPRTDTPGARDAGVPDFIAELVRSYFPPADRERFLAGLADLDERAREAHDRAFLQATAEQQVALLAALDRETYPDPPRQTPPSQAEIRERAEPGTTGMPAPAEGQPESVRWQNEAENRRPARPEVPFWRTMKELTLVGYYTSEPGATQELRYVAVPGRWEACVPLAQIGRAWAV